MGALFLTSPQHMAWKCSAVIFSARDAASFCIISFICCASLCLLLWSRLSPRPECRPEKTLGFEFVLFAPSLSSSLDEILRLLWSYRVRLSGLARCCSLCSGISSSSKSTFLYPITLKDSCRRVGVKLALFIWFDFFLVTCVAVTFLDRATDVALFNGTDVCSLFSTLMKPFCLRCFLYPTSTVPGLLTMWLP